MKRQEVIKQLKSLIDNSENLIIEGEDNSVWIQDIVALNEAIEAVEEKDKLKKRAEEAEMLLREVQPYCLQIDRDKISEFFTK